MKVLIFALFFGPVVAMAAPDFVPLVSSYKETLGALIKADTTNPPGNESRAITILAARLKREKIPYQISDFGPGRQNLVARLKATQPDKNLKPLLLLAHVDVVGTKDQTWSVPQHELTEKDGFLYGRGVLDDLSMGVANLEIFLLLHKQSTPLKRDVILAFTGDEESGGLGIREVLKNNPGWLDAGIALNEGGGLVTTSDGRMKMVRLQVAEKTYQDFTLTARGPTGHSSIPQKGNSIYRLAEALARIGKYQPEEHLLPVTRAYFKAALNDKPEIARAMRAIGDSKGKLPAAALKVIHEYPLLSAALSTTCVATMLDGGTKVNALPPEAHANINCRILPDETIAQVKARLEKVIADPLVVVTPGEDNFGSSNPSPIEGEVPTAVRQITEEMYPGTPVLPIISPGASDSRFLRERGVAAYGISPIASRELDVMRAHGIDERIPADSIQPGLDYLYRLVIKLAGAM